MGPLISIVFVKLFVWYWLWIWCFFFVQSYSHLAYGRLWRRTTKTISCLPSRRLSGSNPTPQEIRKSRPREFVTRTKSHPHQNHISSARQKKTQNELQCQEPVGRYPPGSSSSSLITPAAATALSSSSSSLSQFSSTGGAAIWCCFVAGDLGIVGSDWTKKRPAIFFLQVGWTQVISIEY